jgi:hypothetical protein
VTAAESSQSSQATLLASRLNVSGTIRGTIRGTIPWSLSAASAALDEGQARLAGDLPHLLQDLPLLGGHVGHQAVVHGLGELGDRGIGRRGRVLASELPPG